MFFSVRQEFWEHATQHQWDLSAIHGHCYRLGDTLASTKELIEDNFGHGADSKRSNKNPFKSLAPEKFHLNSSLWGRLDSEQWPKLGTLLGDWATTKKEPFSRRCNIGSFAPTSNSLKIFNAATLKKPGRSLSEPVFRSK